MLSPSPPSKSSKMPLTKNFLRFPIDNPTKIMYNSIRIQRILKGLTIMNNDALNKDNNEESPRFLLTDEDGNELEFELIGSGEVDGVLYYAMIPVEEAEDENRDIFEYVILKSETDEDGEETLVTIDDDEEFDRIADFFDDQFSTVDFDALEND